MWYDYPKKRDFDISFNISLLLDWKNTENKITMKFKQATIMETIDFLMLVEKWGVWDWMADFLTENSDINKTTSWLMRLDKNLSQKVFDTIKNTRFKWTFWNSKGTSDSEPSQPYSAILMMLCEKLSIDPMGFQEKYTVEQMNYLMEWLIYNAQSQTEEWQAINDKNQFSKNNKDEDLLKLIS